MDGGGRNISDYCMNLSPSKLQSNIIKLEDAAYQIWLSGINLFQIQAQRGALYIGKVKTITNIKTVTNHKC